MPKIILPEQFDNQYQDLVERYKELKEKFPEDKQWKKLKHVLHQTKSAYTRDKLYVVKYLNYFEFKQVLFREEQRAWIVRVVELLQKVILQKKLNKEG